MKYSELRRAALCQGHQDKVFPANGRPSNYVKTELCPSCPVRDACLEWALSSPWEPQGTWAGLDASEVRALWMMSHPGATVDRVVGLP